MGPGGHYEEQENRRLFLYRDYWYNSVGKIGERTPGLHAAIMHAVASLVNIACIMCQTKRGQRENRVETASRKSSFLLKRSARKLDRKPHQTNGEANMQESMWM